MCAGRFKISVARRQHSNSWRRRGPDGSGVLLTFLSLRPHREQAPSWAAYTESRWSVFLPPRSLLPASAQLLGFCLFSTLEMIVGLHEEKPGTLPIADRTCLL
jgi:hypothetical protein